MLRLCHYIGHLIEKIECCFSSLSILLLRTALAFPFWKSGLTKWNYIKNGQEDTLFFLFEEYNVPLLPVNIAAYSHSSRNDFTNIACF